MNRYNYGYENAQCLKKIVFALFVLGLVVSAVTEPFVAIGRRVKKIAK